MELVVRFYVYRLKFFLDTQELTHVTGSGGVRTQAGYRQKS